VLFFAAALLVLAPTPEPEPTCPPPPCECKCEPRSPGYWKNHEGWPGGAVKIGGIWYTEADAIEIMKTAGKGDKTYTMFKALAAAKLNKAAGCDVSCIKCTIKAADEWMEKYGPVGSNVRGNSKAWKCGEPLYKKLDKYNNYGC
jgi:hypothetical protein